MNRKTTVFFVALALCSMVLFGLLPGSAGNLLEAGTLPFVSLGTGLRQLSLSGSGGNIAAIVLYAGISLLPLLGLLRKDRSAEDLLLVLASASLFYILYGIINPGVLHSIMATPVGTVIHVGIFCSILISWACLKLLRKADSGSLSFYSILRLLLLVCAGLWIVSGFGLGLLQCREQILAVNAANTAPGLNLLPTYVFLVVSYLLGAAEYGLDALLLIFGASLVADLQKEPYGEGACKLAARMERLSRTSLLVVLFGSLLFHLCQLLFAPLLHQIHTTVELPLFSLCLMFGIMALTKLLQQGRQLKEDNDLFI